MMFSSRSLRTGLMFTNELLLWQDSVPSRIPKQPRFSKPIWKLKFRQLKKKKQKQTKISLRINWVRYNCPPKDDTGKTPTNGQRWFLFLASESGFKIILLRLQANPQFKRQTETFKDLGYTGNNQSEDSFMLKANFILALFSSYYAQKS